MELWDWEYDENFDFKKAIAKMREKYKDELEDTDKSDEEVYESLKRRFEDFDKIVAFMEKLYPAIELDALPSWHDKDFQSMIFGKGALMKYRSFYVQRMGFMLYYKEFIEILDKFLQAIKANTFVELDAGNGILSLLLKRLGYEGKGYTLPPKKSQSSSGKSLNVFEKEAVESGALVYQDIRELYLQETPDVVLASWIPYMGGDEVIEFFEHQWERGIKPQYFVIIAEGYGATGCELFLDWLDMHFERVETLWRGTFWKENESLFLVEKCECYRYKG